MILYAKINIKLSESAIYYDVIKSIDKQIKKRFIFNDKITGKEICAEITDINFTSIKNQNGDPLFFGRDLK